jgi:hypothetical protein
MRNQAANTAWTLVVATSCFCLLASAKESRSTKILCEDHCSSYQHSDSLPDQPAQGVVRLAVGGDSRNDKAHVVPWAFKEARRRGATAFLFLGDLELTYAIDKRFLPQLADLGDIPFYPVIGNHEVETFRIFRLRREESEERVKRFKEEFRLATAPEIKLATGPRFLDTVVYSVDLAGGIHLVALDNVSRKGEGFGPDQLAWLAEDLKAARDANRVVLVGMHKGLANNPVTSHAMDEDGQQAIDDSNKALQLFYDNQVAMVFVSHSHMYAAYTQRGLQVRLTGGMGAPLVKGLAEADGGFHHFLLVDILPGGSAPQVQVQVVKFPCAAPCAPSRSKTDESREIH